MTRFVVEQPHLLLLLYILHSVQSSLEWLALILNSDLGVSLALQIGQQRCTPTQTRFCPLLMTVYIGNGQSLVLLPPGLEAPVMTSSGVSSFLFVWGANTQA